MTFEAQRKDQEKAEREELRRLGQDIQLFLRLAATHFDTKAERDVLCKLDVLASQYACGKNIMKGDNNG